MMLGRITTILLVAIMIALIISGGTMMAEKGNLPYWKGAIAFVLIMTFRIGGQIGVEILAERFSKKKVEKQEAYIILPKQSD